MNRNNRTAVSLPSDREILITRVFDAPRELVFRAHTDPALIPLWWGPRSTTTIVDRMDLRPGGGYRFIHRSQDGSEYVFHGEFREVLPPERLVQTSGIEGEPGVVLETVTFEEQDGRTTLTILDLCPTQEVRDAIIASGMEAGLAESHNRLEELLAEQSAAAPNPSLKPLEILIGDWDMELSNASFLPSSSDTVRGHVSFDWLEGGAFLAIYMGSKPPGTPDALWLVGRDESTSNYIVLYYDTRKVSRVYEMSFSDRTWKIWRDSPGFSQRFEGNFSEDGDIITACWEKSSDGSTWEHDFDVTYTRVR